jgi:ribose transport system permease protein
MQDFLKIFLRRKMFFVLFVMILVMCFSAPVFYKLGNIRNILAQVAVYGVAATGMLFAIICGEMDLSIGSTMAFCGIILVKMTPHVGFIFALILSLAVGGLIGLINGILVAKVKISSFVVTLSMMIILNGISLLVQPTPTVIRIKGFLEFGSGRIGIFPYISLLFLTLIIISQIVLTKTLFGRNMYAVGGKLDAAIKAGINVYRYKLVIFLFTAGTAAVAGIMLVGRIGSSSPIYASDAALSVISSIVIGGVSLSGGTGDAINALIGILIIGVFTNAIAIFGISAFNQLWIKGIILIIVVSVDAYIGNRKKTRTAYKA